MNSTLGHTLHKHPSHRSLSSPCRSEAASSPECRRIGHSPAREEVGESGRSAKTPTARASSLLLGQNHILKWRRNVLPAAGCGAFSCGLSEDIKLDVRNSQITNFVKGSAVLECSALFPKIVRALRSAQKSEKVPDHNENRDSSTFRSNKSPELETWNGASPDTMAPLLSFVSQRFSSVASNSRTEFNICARAASSAGDNLGGVVLARWKPEALTMAGMTDPATVSMIDYVPVSPVWSDSLSRTTCTRLPSSAALVNMLVIPPLTHLGNLTRPKWRQSLLKGC